MYPGTNDTILLIFYLLYSLFVMAYVAYAYVGMGLGGFRMARKIGMTNPWLFWIPMAHVYAMGNLADQQTALCEGKSTSYRKKLLAWNIITICAAMLFVMAMVPILVVATVHGTMDENGTVTICHSKTADLKETVRRADILVSAVGKRGIITGDMVKEGAVVIDVAMNHNDEGKLCGDCVYDEVAAKASYITPVPGGVGPMTRLILMKNTLTAAKAHIEK